MILPCVFCPESVPQAPMLRLTNVRTLKTLVTMHSMKKVCTLGAENVHKSKSNSVWWVTVNAQVHKYQQTDVYKPNH